MDHLPLPSNHNTHINVPYLAQMNPDLSYDNLGFNEFPERKGFKSQSIRLSQGASDFAEHAAIFQSWCFFGLIIEFFRAVKLELSIEDFLRHRGNGTMHLTMYSLPSLSRSMEAMTRDVHINQRADIYCKVKPYLVTSSILVRRLAQAKVDDSTWHVVHLSALMLGEYLTNITKFFLQCTDPTPSPWWGRNKLACELLDAAGSCPSLSKSLLDQEVDQTSIYYLSRIQKDAKRTHIACTSGYCTLEKLDINKYETKHTSDCLGSRICHSMSLDPSTWTILLDIVYAKQTPLIIVIDGTRSRNIEVKVLKSKAGLASPGPDTYPLDTMKVNGSLVAVARRYVCISHVWSDGLGNPHQNSLPACQLLRLQRMVNALYGDGSTPVPFWIDTVCVPLQYPHRGIAIESMRSTYKDADKVLVLDSALTGTSSRMLQATEMVMRLKASSWVRRLWTFHEAYLAKELHYQCLDVALRLSDMREKYHQELPKSLLDNNTNREKRVLEKDNDLPHAANSHPNKRGRERREGGDLLWWEAYHFLSQVEVLGKAEPQEDYARLRSIIHPLRWRTTSRMQDETICLSGCLNRTVEDLPWESSATDDASIAFLIKERMKRFLLSLRSVPVGLLFAQRPRIEEDGCRWMPTSFLGGGMDSTLPDAWQKEETPVVGRPTTAGLVVQLPGILLSDVTKYTQNFAGGHTHDIIFVRIDGHAYYAYGISTTPVRWDVDSEIHLALILREEPDQRGTFACLVTMSAQTAEVNHCKLMSCVMLMGNPEIHRNLAATVFSGATLTKPTQQWCVA